MNHLADISDSGVVTSDAIPTKMEDTTMGTHGHGARSGRWSGGLLWAALASVSALTLAACSGGTGESGAAAADTNGSGGGDKTVVTEAMGPVEEVDAPTEAFTPPSGKHILIMPCGSAGQGCINESDVSEKVAESLGWTVDVIDGKLDPTVWNQTVKQAASTGVDGIIAISADPNLYGDAMELVAEKDIPFVLTEQTPGDQDVDGIDSFIAPDPAVGGPDVAEWVIEDSGGNTEVLLLDIPGFTNVQQRTAAMAETLESSCEDCVVHREDITAATFGTSLAPLVTNTLQQHPGIKYIWCSDDAVVSFVQQGVQQAGKSGSVKVMSMTGYPEQMTQLETGEMALELASATPYAAWLSVDTLARLMAGEPTEKFWALPQRIWTTQNIGEAPASVFENGWDIEFDYQAMFHELWGTE